MIPISDRMLAFASYLRRRVDDAGMAPLAVLGDADAVPHGTEIALLPGPPDLARLARIAASSGLGCHLAGPDFALLDRLDPSAVGGAPDGFDVLAIVTTYNEADIVGGLVERLVGDGVRVHVVDNWSSDATAGIVDELSRTGRCTSERFPSGGPSPHFELEALLRRVEDIAAHSGADWVVHHDADEVREPPWRGVTLRDALYAVGSFGFNCIDHTVANFVPVDDTFDRDDDLAEHFSYFSFGEAPGHFLQQKAWRPADGPVEMASSGGHEARFDARRVFPYKFLLRHYPIRSQAHGEQKIFRERRARFSPAERARGWHVHYDEIVDGTSFLGDPESLHDARDLDGALLVERLSGAGLAGNPFPGEGPARAGSTPGTERVAAAGSERVRHTNDTPLVLRVQSVLYCPPPGGVERYLRAVGQAVRVLTLARPEISVDLALADNSPESTYDADAVERLRWGFTGTGLRSMTYDHLPENPGHGGAHNALLASDAAHADLVLLLNPDTCISPRLAVELVTTLRDGIGIVEARQLPLEHQKAYDMATGDVGWASGACSLIRREVFEKAGEYDSSSFFLYCDDVDLSWRARLAGFRVVYQPAAVCFHDKRLSAEAAEQPSRTEVYHSGLARLILMTKYSRPELVGPQFDAYESSPEAVHQEIAREFVRRRTEGRLPAGIDPDNVIADFSTYSYAPLRFDYAR